MMKFSRRKFIGFLGLAGIASGSTAKASYVDLENDNQNINEPQLQPLVDTIDNKPILPRALKKGSLIAITAPASPTSMGEISSGVKALKNMGYEIEVGNTIKAGKNDHRYLSASDDDRAEEFMNFIVRDDIDAIISGRGGYGVMRILQKLDFDIIRKNPKIIMGFSDITALLVGLNTCCNLVSFHGPVASSTFNAFTLDYLHKVLTPAPEFSPFSHEDASAIVVNEGIASGKLTGGNLSLVVSTLGTPYEINTKGSILFLEDVMEHPYKVDRMLTQLVLANKIQDSNGVIFGKFKGLNIRKSFFPNRSYTILEVIEQIMQPLEKPCMLNLPFGHTTDKLTFPLGVQAEINTKNKSITIMESSVI